MRRTSGSPPVSRTSRTPIALSSPTSRAISSNVRISGALEPGEALGRHAVLAAEVAPVGDGHAQIADQPAVSVAQWLKCHFYSLASYGSMPGASTEQAERDHVLAPVWPRACSERSSASRVKPARSATRWDGDVAGGREQVDPLEPERLKRPAADEPHARGWRARRRGRRARASSRPRLGGAPRRGAESRPSRAGGEVVAGDDRERGRRAGVQRRTALEQIRLGVDLAVVLGHSRPAGDLRVLAGARRSPRRRHRATPAARSARRRAGAREARSHGSPRRTTVA